MQHVGQAKVWQRWFNVGPEKETMGDTGKRIFCLCLPFAFTFSLFNISAFSQMQKALVAF